MNQLENGTQIKITRKVKGKKKIRSNGNMK